MTENDDCNENSGGYMKPKNTGREWSNSDVQKLRQMAKQNVDTDVIAKNLQRTKSAVYNKASEIDVSLKPKDR